MKQIVRKVINKNGVVSIEEIPAPTCGDNQVLISTRNTLISTGTELATLKKTPVELVKQTLSDPWMHQAFKQVVEKETLFIADMGHFTELEQFADRINGKETPDFIDIQAGFDANWITLAAADQLSGNAGPDKKDD